MCRPGIGLRFILNRGWKLKPDKYIRVGSVQFNHHPGDKDYNIGVIETFAAQAAAEGVKILVFPEMCITGYWHVRNLSREAIHDLAEPVPAGPSMEKLKTLAQKHDMMIGAGLIERAADGRLFNSYVCCLPDGSTYVHRKLHCFISEHMSSGEGYTVFQTPFGCKVGILICWDNNLIENVRATALAGADILLAPHQTGGCDSRSPHAMGKIEVTLWQNRKANRQAIEEEFLGPKGRQWLLRWLPARAHDNGLFVIFSNGVGQDDDEVRTGNAMIIDCYGRILNETSRPQDTMVVADLDLTLLPLCTGRRWMRGRRPELYNVLTESSGQELDPLNARFSDKPVS